VEHTHPIGWVAILDEPTDLAEVLIHGRGVALQLLKSLGFVLLDDGQRMCARNQNQDPEYLNIN